MARLLFAAALLAALAGAGRADELVIRGNYYRDRNTRVIQPEAELSKDFATGTTVGAHYLLDTITSASVAAGVKSDQPFTELRNEFGVRLGQRFGRGQLTARYSYSSESDYWAHTVSLSGTLDLYKKNTQLGLAVAYGHDNVAQRMAATTYTTLGTLDTLHFIGSLSQVLHKTLLFNLSYDLAVSGFGTQNNGFQANPYRTVILGGSPSREKVPFQRVKQSLAAGFNWVIPLGSTLVPYIGFRPSYRFYWDDWTVLSSTPELRIFVPVGPAEFRVTGRYYTQRAASFWSDLGDGKPFYPGNTGKACQHCLSTSTRGQTYFTAAPKLGEMDDMFLELRLMFRLHGLRRLSAWLSEGLLEMSYGHLFNDKYAHTAFGDAEVAGLTLTLPL